MQGSRRMRSPGLDEICEAELHPALGVTTLTRRSQVPESKQYAVDVVPGTEAGL
jgi:hypothetical protein